MNGLTAATPSKRRMQSGLTALALAALLATPAGAAEVLDDGEPQRQETESSRDRELEFSANATLATDYVFRGVSQTDRSPAIQGGFEATYNPFYLGIWASNVDFGGDVTAADEEVDVANIEVDFFGGLRKTIDDVTLDIGVLYYHYPNAFSPEADLDYIEFKGAVSAELPRSTEAELKFLYSPDYSGGIGETVNVEGELSKSLGHGFEVSGALGYFANLNDEALLADGSQKYWYWNAGISKTFNEKYTFDVRYWDTNGSSECGEVTLFQCDARIVGQLNASF